MLPYSTAHASGAALDLVMLSRILVLACFSILSLTNSYRARVWWHGRYTRIVVSRALPMFTPVVRWWICTSGIMDVGSSMVPRYDNPTVCDLCRASIDVYDHTVGLEIWSNSADKVSAARVVSCAARCCISSYGDKYIQLHEIM